MRNTVRAAVAALAGGVALIAGSAGAGAAASAPAGYTIVTSPATAPASTLDAGGLAVCPTGTVAWGGGVGFSGFGSQSENIETTDPAGSAGWNARVNNRTGASVSFNVDAICANKPAAYKIVTKTVDNPPSTQTTATVTCPAKTVVLSGGTFSSSDSASVQAVSLFPAGQTRFTARMDNASSSDANFQVQAVCARKPAQYTIVKHTDSDPAGTIDLTGAICPAGTAVLGGGVNPASPVTPPSISESTDNPLDGWAISILNTSSVSMNLTSYAICAA